MKYLVFLMIVLSGCGVTPRYHQRGFQVSWLGNARLSGSSKDGVKTTQNRHSKSENVRLENREVAGESKATVVDSIIAVQGAQGPINRYLNQGSPAKHRPINVHSSPLKSVITGHAPKPKVSIFKPKDREGRLELTAMICYSIGLAMVLVSWALASEWIFIVGAFLLTCGAIAVLALGINNITHSFNGYMTIFTVLGAVYLIARFGWLEELANAWKH
jgi:hypothetical protein